MDLSFPFLKTKDLVMLRSCLRIAVLSLLAHAACSANNLEYGSWNGAYTPDNGAPAGWPEPSLRARVIVQDLGLGKTMVQQWSDSIGLKTVELNEEHGRVRCLLTGTPDQVARTRDRLAGLGEISDLRYYAVDRKREREDLGYEYVRILDRLETLQASKPTAQEGTEWARRVEELQSQAGRLEMRIMHLQAWDSVATLQLELQTETSTPSYSDVAFVNMPGVEYVALFFENPSSEFSADAYQGAQIKYLFTRGKSYLSFGLLRPISDPAKADTLAATEIFTFAFGQDFYSRRLGQGLRRAFNLYTGYQVGGAYLTSDAQNTLVWNVTPCLGLELYKSKRILLDTRAAYFIPFEHNRELRGFMALASFNFVF
jgi:hypothetical protein